MPLISNRSLATLTRWTILFKCFNEISLTLFKIYLCKPVIFKLESEIAGEYLFNVYSLNKIEKKSETINTCNYEFTGKKTVSSVQIQIV